MLDQLLVLKGKLIRRNGGTKLALAPKKSEELYKIYTMTTPDSVEHYIAINLDNTYCIDNVYDIKEIENNNELYQIVGYKKPIINNDNKFYFNEEDIEFGNSVDIFNDYISIYNCTFNYQKTISCLIKEPTYIKIAELQFDDDCDMNNFLSQYIYQQPNQDWTARKRVCDYDKHILTIYSLDKYINDMSYLFYGLHNTDELLSDGRRKSTPCKLLYLIDTKNVTNMTRMFQLSHLDHIPDIDFSNVKNIDSMFDLCAIENSNEILQIYNKLKDKGFENLNVGYVSENLFNVGNYILSSSGGGISPIITNNDLYEVLKLIPEDYGGLMYDFDISINDTELYKDNGDNIWLKITVESNNSNKCINDIDVYIDDKFVEKIESIESHILYDCWLDNPLPTLTSGNHTLKVIANRYFYYLPPEANIKIPSAEASVIITID